MGLRRWEARRAADIHVGVAVDHKPAELSGWGAGAGAGGARSVCGIARGTVGMCSGTGGTAGSSCICTCWVVELALLRMELGGLRFATSVSESTVFLLLGEAKLETLMVLSRCSELRDERSDTSSNRVV